MAAQPHPYAATWQPWDERYEQHLKSKRNSQIACGLSSLASVILAGGSEAARWQLQRFKLAVLAIFATSSLLLNRFITERVAALLGYRVEFGPRRILGLYDPWEWLVWWLRWRNADELQRLWDSCLHTAWGGMVAIAGGAMLALACGRFWILRQEVPDLHGSARWANPREVIAAGFLARGEWLRWLRKPLVRMRLMRRRLPQYGIYLGTWRRAGKRHLLRDCGPGHVLLEAPTRAGKGVNSSSIPTLLTWPHSALIHDLKGEN